MAIAIKVAGACQIKIDAGQGAGLEELGYAANGVDIEGDPRWLDVPGDQRGGDDGTPIGWVWLSELYTVRMELTKFDAAVLAKVRARIPTATAGTPPAAGTVVDPSTTTKFFRLLLNAANDIWNFPLAIPKGLQGVNLSTKFERVMLEWECHMNSSGLLYNQSAS